MHILHLIDSLGGGGAERMLVDIANCTVTIGHEVSVCQTRCDGLLSSSLRTDIEVLTLNRKSRFDLLPIRRFGRWLNDHSVDLIHVHGRSSFLFLSIFRMLRQVREPVILHDHFGKIDVDKSTPLWFRLFGQNVDMYVGVSQQLSAWAISSGIDRNKVVHITNFLDLNRFRVPQERDIRAELPHSGDSILGIVVCGLRREKGVDLLVRALASLNHANLIVVIAGGEAEPGYLAECQNLVKSLSLQDRVFFLGQRMDIVECLSSFDFAVIPSVSESGPLVLIEFLMSRLPVIATRTGQVSAEVEKAGIGIFVDPGDIQALADAIADMAQQSEAERKATGTLGVEFVHREFDLNRKIDLWLNVYREVLEVK